MRKLALFLAMLGLTSIAFATTPVTVEQLSQIVASSNGKRDAETALRFRELNLTERLSSKALLDLKSKLPGEKARQALVVLADASVFLDPPQADVLTLDPPTQNEQSKLISLIYEYLEKTNPKLPNFFASRLTVRYKEDLQQIDKPQIYEATDLQRMMLAGTSRTAIYYRNGYEDVDASTKGKDQDPEDNGLVTKGIFGPVPNVVFFDAIDAHSRLKWARWEQGASGPLAVFRYRIPEDASHNDVSYCCIPDGNQLIPFKKRPGYHGEIAIDPTSGAIQRLTLEADLDLILPLVRSDIMVEYGTVLLGGLPYTCPLRSVSISRGRSIQMFRLFKTFGPYVTLLNDVTFEQYHLFRSESRVLTDPNSVIK
jgi:hypothetical protein